MNSVEAEGASNLKLFSERTQTPENTTAMQ